MNAQRSLFHDQTPTVDEVMSVWQGDREWKSRRMICEALGRAKSPAIISVLTVLTNIGYLTVKNEPLPNGADYYFYAPTQKWLDDALPY